MSLAHSPVIGTIRVQPPASAAEARQHCDDSTLGLVLESFARRDSLDHEPGEVRLVASTRLCRQLSEAGIGVRANLAQLLEDLQAEYDQIAERLEG